MNSANGGSAAGAQPAATAGVQVFPFAEVPSALDTAFDLAAEGRLGIWASVLAASQTAGRGQLRRRWSSPPGNIYAALRLPLSPPFDGGAAAAAVGLLAAEALRSLGWQVRIKWPNDLVLEVRGAPRKVAGILLEERGGILLAGIGVNVLSHPPADALRAEAALPAVSLAESGQGGRPPAAPELWSRLVSRMLSSYTDARIFAGTWLGRAETLLLWRGCAVTVTDSEAVLKGRLAGLWPSGALRLETGKGAVEVTGGSLRPA